MQRTLLISLLLTFSNFINAQSENEPNNTITQANFLSTNISGNISPASDTDWYKFGTDINKGVIMHVIPPTGLPLSISFYYYKSEFMRLGTYKQL